MNDSLRDKIATVYRAHRLTFEGRSSPKCDCGWKSPEEYTTWTDHPEHVADAVIRELNLSIAVYYKTSQGREVCVEGYWTEESNDD